MKQVRSRYTILLAVCVSVLLFFTSSTGVSAAEPIKIGVVLSVTGWGGAMGTPMKEAMTTIVDEVNKNGGVQGRKIELLVEDDQSNPTTAVISATKLSRDMKVALLMGPTTTDSGMAMIPVAEQEHVPFVLSGPVIAPLKKWVFHTVPNDIVNSSAVMEYAVKKIGGKRIAVIHDTANFGVTGMKVFTSEVTKYPGVSIVAQEKFETTDTNVVPQLMKIKAANPDVLLIQTPAIQAAVVAKNYRQLGMKMPVVGPPTVTTPDFLRAAGSVAEQSPWILLGSKIGCAETFPLDDPWRKNLYEPFKKIMRAKYGPSKPITIFHSVAHDAVYIAITALKASNPDDRNSVRNALETIKYEGTLGPYACTPTDHRGVAVYNGVPVVVKAGEYVPYKK